MIDHGKLNVLGVYINAVDYSAAVSKIISAARENQPLAVSALAVHGVMTGVLDQTHRYRLNHFDLIVPDGQPVRWALRWLHGEKLQTAFTAPPSCSTSAPRPPAKASLFSFTAAPQKRCSSSNKVSSPNTPV